MLLTLCNTYISSQVWWLWVYT